MVCSNTCNHTELRKVIRIGVYGVALQDNMILLTSKGTCGCYAGLLDLPGGGVEFGESPEETLRREFQEEVGMSFAEMKLLDNLSHTQDVHNVPDPFAFHQLGQIYSVTGVHAIPDVLAQDEFAWYPLAALRPEQLTPFAKVVFSRFFQEI